MEPVSCGSLLYTIEEAAKRFNELVPDDERVKQILRLVNDLQLERRAHYANARYEGQPTAAPR